MNEPWTIEKVMEIYSEDGIFFKPSMMAVVKAHNEEVAELRWRIDMLSKMVGDLAHSRMKAELFAATLK